MARYSQFLGRNVLVHYRAGDILLPASGRFVGDSGRSVFLEQSFIQHGVQKNFRWEIPYRHIVQLEEVFEGEEEAESSDSASASTGTETAREPRNTSASAKDTSKSSPLILPADRPETA